MRIKLIFINLIVLFLCSCLGLNRNKIERNIIQTFDDIEKKTNVKVNIAKKNLECEIYVYSPSFIDQETHKLIISFLTYNLYENIVKFDTIKYVYVDEKFEHDPSYYIYSKDQAKKIHSKFYSNLVFLELAEYCLSNMTQDEVLNCSIIIEELNNTISDKFNFKGSFWLLLNRFSKSYDNPDEIGFKNFKIFAQVASVKEINIDSKHFINLFKICGLEADKYNIPPRPR